MTNKIFIDMLNEDSVSIKVQKVIYDNGVEYKVGDPWRKAYVNSVSDRKEIDDEVSEPYKTAILSMWGDSPTVKDE